MTLSRDNKRRVAAFLTIGTEELRAARKLLPDLPDQSMFFLQQAAEKLLRACIEAEGKIASITHNLRTLAEVLGKDHSLYDLFVLLQDLSSAATRYRYPTSSGNIMQLDADPQAALLEVEKTHATVLEFLKKKLPDLKV
jgi:HEPN domain-containing protein